MMTKGLFCLLFKTTTTKENMNKTTKVKSIISGIFKNIPVYVEIYTNGMKEATQHMKELIPVPFDANNEFDEFMKIYIDVISEGIAENRKSIECVLKSELKELTLKELDFIETALNPEIIKSMTRLNFALLPIMMRIAMGTLQNEAFMEKMSGLVDLGADFDVVSKPVKKYTKLGKSVKIKTSKRNN
jgi:transcription termination factor NusB